ncbi:hypothetical protein FRB97_005639 [Tulasnella sp. 331]|nr:hypothetical protein FRB97_005639 [Tulasnella sp. 331]
MDKQQSISLLAHPQGKVPASDLSPSTPSFVTSAVHRIYTDSKLRLVLFVVLLSVACLNIFDKVFPSPWKDDRYVPATCVQVDPLRPFVNGDLASHLKSIYEKPDFSSRAADWLGGAVRIPTELFDDNGPVGEDPRWDVFGKFHDYLRGAFPKVHEELTLIKVNTYGLLYTWTGLLPYDSLTPVKLIDVVPVEPRTYSQWEEPPFSGVLKDGWIWGRGSCDDKRGLIGNLASVETLLEADFRPRRTIILAFGFDEESGGNEGARKLGTYLRENGPNEFALILDEGGTYSHEYGQMFAGVSTSEKGYFDVEVKVAAPGGHSSVPPAHTTIGFLSQLIGQLESTPHPPHLTRSSTVFELYQCYAAHAPDLPETLRRTIVEAGESDEALKRMEFALINEDTPRGRMIAAMLRTTQAVDIISGGVKINALPEEAYAIINHRVSTDSSIGELKHKITSLFTQFTADRKLGLTAFGKNVHQSLTWKSPGFTPIANVTISEAFGSALEPAPVTPTTGAAWRLLGGTIRSAYQDSEGDEKQVIVTPTTVRGNTDTRWYWGLSPNIFRYSHIGAHHSRNGAHTVNEAVKLEGFVNCIKFYTTLIMNADEADSL